MMQLPLHNSVVTLKKGATGQKQQITHYHIHHLFEKSRKVHLSTYHKHGVTESPQSLSIKHFLRLCLLGQRGQVAHWPFYFT
jgi:hypothetical protein